MREFSHMSSVIELLRGERALVEFFENRRDAIIETWLEYAALSTIIASLGYSKEDYRTKIATGILNNFFTVLRAENKSGDCPVMRAVVTEFYAMGLTVEDVFISCTAFKNTLILFLEREGDSRLKHHLLNLMTVLDHNLYGVLSIYSEMKCAHDAELEFRNRVIQENVLYTRTDMEGVIVEVTDAFCNFSGYGKEDLIGKTHAVLKHPDVNPEVYEELWKTITSGNMWSGNLLNLSKTGKTLVSTIRIVPVYDEAGAISEYMAFRTDITSDEMAKVDPLTGLYNRRELDSLFQKLYNNTLSKSQPLSVILADIDHFKQINDTFGHHEGDDVIVRFAGILRSCTRNSDVCARWGGEEFIILLPNTELHTAFDVAERIRHAALSCLHVGDHAVTSSFGVARLERGENVHDLFKRVDSYLYCAKENGRNRTIAKRALSKMVNLSPSNTFSSIIP